MRLRTLFSGLLVAVAAACGGSPANVPNADPTVDPVADGEDDVNGVHRWCDPQGKRAHPLVLAVEPGAKSSPWTDALAGAKKSVHVMLYQMGAGPILDGLVAAAQRGLEVSVILDVSQKPVNDRFRPQLEAAGAHVTWSDPAFSFMHAKVMVADKTVAVVSTGNYSAAQLDAERNYVLTDVDVHDVAALEALFAADLARTAPDLSCTRLLVSPVNARERLLALIASAKTELLVESMQLADSAVRDAIVARKNAGVAVRIVLADPSWIDANASAAAFLARNAIDARRMEKPKVHVKSILVDGKVAYAGSENLSQTSLEKNREVGLLVTEPENVATMKATFDADWAIAKPF